MTPVEVFDKYSYNTPPIVEVFDEDLRGAEVAVEVFDSSHLRV